MKKFATVLVFLLVLLVLLFAAGSVLVLRAAAPEASTPALLPAATATPAPTPEPTGTAYYITPSGTTPGESLPAGSVFTLADPAPIEGYTFLGWRDAAGSLHYQDAVTLEQDSYFAAEYAVALGTAEHTPYMSCDAAGFALPGAAATRREVAVALYTELATPISGNTGFADVAEDDACYSAVCALRQLGVLDGSRFHPDEAITLRELLTMVSPFFPVLSGECSFADVPAGSDFYAAACNAALHGWVGSGAEVALTPDADLTRAEFALIMNRVLGRGPASGDAVQGFTLPDLDTAEVSQLALLEAIVTHTPGTAADGSELWTAYTRPETAQTGLVLAGYDLYYIQEDGRLAVSTDYDCFSFDENGRYTSGVAELDKVVRAQLAALYTPGMTREELLRAAYMHVVEDFTYHKGELYAVGEQLPCDELALSFLSTGEGNCYGFACGFRALARALGYDCRAYSGLASNKSHSWTDILIDGVLYVCDPELEYQYYNMDYQDMFMKTYPQVWKWYYTKTH